MSQGKSYAAKVKNHQWRLREPFDELWFSRVGFRPNESLYETFDTPVPQVPHPWGHLPVLPTAAIGGNALLESRMHALVGAMAHFTPSPQGVASHSVASGLTNAPPMAFDSRPPGHGFVTP